MPGYDHPQLAEINAAEDITDDDRDALLTFDDALTLLRLSQAHLESRYGWVRGSTTASRYVTIFGKDADNELAKLHGFDVEEDVKQDYADTEPGDDAHNKSDALDDLLEDPEVRSALLEKRGET